MACLRRDWNVQTNGARGWSEKRKLSFWLIQRWRKCTVSSCAAMLVMGLQIVLKTVYLTGHPRVNKVVRAEGYYMHCKATPAAYQWRWKEEALLVDRSRVPIFFTGTPSVLDTMHHHGSNNQYLKDQQSWLGDLDVSIQRSIWFRPHQCHRPFHHYLHREAQRHDPHPK